MRFISHEVTGYLKTFKCADRKSRRLECLNNRTTISIVYVCSHKDARPHTSVREGVSVFEMRNCVMEKKFTSLKIYTFEELKWQSFTPLKN